MSQKLLLVLASLAAVGSVGCAEDGSQPVRPEVAIFSSVPSKIDPEARYLFYLHGAIIERAGSRPTHPRFGVYEYEEILELLAGRGFIVISEARPAGTDVTEYAETVAEQVRSLLDAGVPPGHISVVGFSKGGGIAATTSWILEASGINFVLMGACGSWLNERPEIVPHGRVLSLTEASDEMAGSCEGLFARTDEDVVHREVVLNIGGGHGAFYRPQPEWIEATVGWVTADEGPDSISLENGN